MPDSILCEIERRLIASRLPLARRQRALQELVEHREDLIRAALEDGVSENEAAIRAELSLGDPAELAEQIVLAARRSSWWGRHPIVSFCVMPFFGIVFAFLLAYALVLFTSLFFILAPEFSGFTVPKMESALTTYFAQITFCEHIAQLVVVAAVALMFCNLALQSASKRRWLWVAASICSVQGYLWMMTIRPHCVTIGYFLWPKEFVPVTSALIPFAIAAFIDLRQRRLQQNKIFLAATIALMPFLGTGCATHQTKNTEPPLHTRAWIGGEYRVARKYHNTPFQSSRIAYTTNYPTAVPYAKAIRVTRIATNSPAYIAGLRSGDYLTEVANKKVKNLHQLRHGFNSLPAGSTVQLKVIRDNKPLNLTVQSGTEKYHNGGCLSIALPTVVEGWDLWPNPGFSLVFVGYQPNDRIRRDLNGHNEIDVQKWHAWCVIFDISSTDQIMSQERGTK